MGNQEALTAGDDMEAPDPFIGGWGGTDSGDTDPAEDDLAGCLLVDTVFLTAHYPEPGGSRHAR